MNLNKEILRLSLPAIVSNLTVPLLGLCDTAISGHLGDVTYLGAIAVGSMMTNPVFWLFGFLRMGTSGLTAQSFGANEHEASRRLLWQSLLLGMTIGLLLMVFRYPLGRLLTDVIAADSPSSRQAMEYFTTVMLSAPALLGTMSILGWMLGRQNTIRPMILSISVNIVNILLSLTLVYGIKLGFSGIPIGTVAANWVGLLLAVILAMPMLPAGDIKSDLSRMIRDGGWGKFFRINTDIFFRSACIMVISGAMTAFGARIGTVTLAANAVMLQFFHIFSYFMDGIAFTAEALCGRFAGCGDRVMLRCSIMHLLLWGGVIMLFFLIVYAAAYMPISSFITSEQEVLDAVNNYHIWLFLIPPVTVMAFIFDGIYIGLTATRQMLGVTVAGAICFFMVCMLHYNEGIWQWCTPESNTLLWVGFMGYLFIRGAALAVMTPAVIRRQPVSSRPN